MRPVRRLAGLSHQQASGHGRIQGKPQRHAGPDQCHRHDAALPKFGSDLCRDLRESVKTGSLRRAARMLSMWRRSKKCCRCGVKPALGHHSRAAGLPATGRTHSSVCTGGAVVAEGADGGVLGAAFASPLEVATPASFSTRAAAGLAAALPTASARAPRTRSLEACRRCRADPDRSIPQDRAIAGPAE